MTETIEKKERKHGFAKAFGLTGDRGNWAAKYDAIIDKFKFYDPGVAKKYKNRVRLHNKRARALQRALLKKDGTPNDITNDILASFDSFLKPESAGIFVIYGLLKSGKSRLTAYFCKRAEDANPGAITIVTTAIAELNDAYAQAPPHSSAVGDEDMEATGEGSRVEEKDLHNFQKLAREGEINTFLNFKKYRNIEIANYYFEMFGWDTETGESRALVRDELGDYMGHIIVKKNYDDEFYRQFQKKKTNLYEHLRKTKGHIGAFGSTNTRELANRVWEIYKTKNANYTRASDFRAFIEDTDELEDLGDLSEIVKGKIVRILVKRMKDEPRPSRRIQETQAMPQDKKLKSYRTLQEYEDIPHLSLIINELRLMKVNPLHLQVFELKCQRENNLAIHQQLGISLGSVSNYMNEILQKTLGYAGEHAKHKQLTAQGRKHKMGGGNSADPDCICYEPLEVHTIKTFHVFRIHKAMTEIAQSEIDFAIQNHCPLILDGYETSTQKWYICHIFLQEADQQVSTVGSCDLRNAGVMSTPSSLPGIQFPSPNPALPVPEEGAVATFAGGMGGAQQKSKRRRHR